jgi:NADPH-dependent ferric siderophore reductase
MNSSCASVVETIQLSPRLRRITLQVEDRKALAIRRAGESAVGVYFRHPRTATAPRHRS